MSTTAKIAKQARLIALRDQKVSVRGVSRSSMPSL
jgi:hypothetical protein